MTAGYYNKSELAYRILAVGLCSFGVIWAQAPVPPGQQQAPAPRQIAPSQPTGQLDASEALFTVLAAINVAGYDADIDSPNNSPVRKQVRDIITAKHLAAVEPLKKFVAEHQLTDPSAELSQYISYALTLDGPPKFLSRIRPEEVPMDVRKLEGFSSLLGAFYEEAGIHELWNRARPAHDQAIGVYHAGVTQALFATNAYLRNPTSGFAGRRFQIYVDLLGAPNQIQTRSYKDEYFVVLTPTSDPQIDQIRHAYLHYLLDPLAIRYYEQLGHLKPLADFAQPAPALDNAFKDDFVLFSTECIVKAVESRLAPRGDRDALADQAAREGFVLVPGLADGLAVYEKQEQSLRQYYIDWVNQVDLAREDKRLEKIQFANDPTVRKARVMERPQPVQSPVEKALAEAEELYSKRSLDEARAAYTKLLDQPSQSGSHAKAYYGLARIAALQRDPELAEKLFQKTLELGPDTETKSWAYLYLGRLADAAGEREQAEQNYRSVLAIDGASASVKSAAEKGLAQAFRRN